MIRLIEAVLWFTLYALLMIAAWTMPVHAHSWYEWECCSDQDCSPMASDEFYLDDGDVVIVETGERISLSETHPSQDGDWHRCIYLNGSRQGQTRKHTRGGMCIYVPPSF